MEHQGTAQLVYQHLAALNRGDLDGLLDTLADDAVWVTGEHVVRGRDDLAEFFRTALTQLAPQLSVTRIIVDGPLAACELLETVVFDGERRDFSIAAFYEVAEGRIASVKVYREGSAEV
jgi:uncharacterized protein (TIGR02246 family)